MRLKYEEIKNTKFSCFYNYFFIEEWYLYQIIGLVGWGSKRVIRQQGFRILPLTKKLKHIKQWPIINDPEFIIKESCYISKKKGQSVIVVHVGEINYERDSSRKELGV